MVALASGAVIGGYMSIAIFMLLGVVFYAGMDSYRKSIPAPLNPSSSLPLM